MFSPQLDCGDGSATAAGTTHRLNFQHCSKGRPKDEMRPDFDHPTASRDHLTASRDHSTTRPLRATTRPLRVTTRPRDHLATPMSLFNQTRLTNAVFKLDAERMRWGWYSDKYFETATAKFHLQGGFA